MRRQGYFCPSVANAAGEVTGVEAAEHSAVPGTAHPDVCPNM